jgi:hypothetical protein
MPFEKALRGRKPSDRFAGRTALAGQAFGKQQKT